MKNAKKGITGSLVYGDTHDLCQTINNRLFELESGALGIRNGDTFYHYGTTSEIIFAPDTFYSTYVTDVYVLYVGMGVTRSCGSDCYPATVVKIDGNRIWTTDDEYVHVSGNFQSNTAVFRYETNWEQTPSVWSIRKNGRFYRVGLTDSYSALSLNGRHYHQDPSF